MKRMDAKYPCDYFIFGVKVTIRSTEKRIHDRLGAFLEKCQDRDAKPSADAQINFALYSAEYFPQKPAIPETAALVSSPEFSVKIYKTSQKFYLAFEKSWLRLSFPECHGIGVFDEKIWKYSGAAESFFFSGLCVMFHYRGLYQIHSAGLTFQEKGFLFIGKSGSGKSTVALTLVKRGWKYLSDDILFLRLRGFRAEMLAIPLEFKTDDRTFHGFFPGAERDFGFKLPHDNGIPYYDKYYVRMDRLYPERFESHCLPRFLFFTEVSTNDASDLAILGKNETLKHLLEASLIFMFDAHHAAKHLEVLNVLVRQTTAYRLHAGRDVMENPEAFEKFLLENTQ